MNGALGMLGVYDGFPENVHRIDVFAFSASPRTLQETLVHRIQELSTETLRLEDAADPSVPECTVNFEFGIAEANDFNYVNAEEASRLVKTIRKEPLRFMDFLCAARYYRTHKNTRTPLRFDYFLLRFEFGERVLEVRTYHERGPQYTSPEDLVKLLSDGINKVSGKKILRGLEPV